MRAADTIAAIATPPGRGAVGVVRVSGDRVPALIDALLGRALPPRVATLAAFRGAHGELLDQGLAIHFPAPHSYTAEHVVELHGHGGPAVLRLLLGRCVELGVRLAEPGEFTLRAFLNGKLDLAQAEGVADLIDAATTTAARAAARSLSGEFSRAIHAEVDALVELRALTEATLDFPDDDIDLLAHADAHGRLARARAALADILTRGQTGAALRAGLSVVLVGQPNVGKSSLLNRLAGDEVAIVTPIAGTTRDTVRSQIELAGIPLSIVDTAGLRPTDDPIETLGIERTWAAVRDADLALVLVDARETGVGIGSADAGILAELPARLPRLVVHNKIDLAGVSARVAPGLASGEAGEATRCHVWLCARSGEGVELLRREMLATVGLAGNLEGSFLARERHLTALNEAATHLAAAATQLASADAPLELFAEELREAQLALSRITGELSADDLLGEIFSRFCIGK